MRGKIVVIVFAVGAVAFAIYGALFVFNPSPVDQRFNLTRYAVPSTMAQAALLPDSLDDFKRVGDVSNTSAGASGGRYVNNTYVVDFNVTSAKGKAADSILNQPSCQGGSVITHAQNNGKLPYSYSTCQNSYAFQWVNGDWLFSASSVDPEALLRFVNLYGY